MKIHKPNINIYNEIELGDKVVDNETGEELTGHECLAIHHGTIERYTDGAIKIIKYNAIDETKSSVVLSKEEVLELKKWL